MFFFFLFINFLLWHRVAEVDVLWQKTEKAYGLNGTIVPFVTSNDSRRDNETCWLLDVKSLTKPPDSVILSPKTKGSVIPQKSRIGRVELVV